jgi:hypothetical protein
MTRLLGIVFLVALAAGCSSTGAGQSGSKEGESKSSMISDLQSARLSASTLSARKLLYKKVEGMLAKGDTPARYKAYYSDDVLRIVEEVSSYGDFGESDKGYFLDAASRLFYYVASDERVKDSGKEKVKIRIAYDDSGKVVGSEKTVNGQPGKLSEAELKSVKARLDALRKAADSSRKPK